MSDTSLCPVDLSHSSVYTMERWLDVIFSGPGCFAVIIDDDGMCRYLSPNWENLTGYTTEQTLNTHFDLMVHPEDVETLQAFVPSHAPAASLPRGENDNTPKRQCEYRFRHLDGKWQWHLAEMTACKGLTLDGSILLVSRNITSYKVNEKRLEQAKVAIDIARSSRRQFLSHMHHELRTPLNAVIGFADMMLAEMFGPLGNGKYMQYVQHIRESGHELLTTIDNMLELASLSSGQIELKESPQDIRDIARNAVEACQYYATQHHVTLQLQIPDQPVTLTIDMEHMVSALHHIIHNAIKFSPPYAKVIVKAGFLSKETFCFAICDQGEGMSERKLRTVMQPFTMDDVMVGSHVRGVGLGLCLARQLIEMHGGRLDIQSKLGEGSTVYIEIPTSRIRLPGRVPEHADAEAMHE